MEKNINTLEVLKMDFLTEMEFLSQERSNLKAHLKKE